MKDQDYIENLITGKIGELDNAEPPEGHFERFRDRLESENKAKTFNWRIVWKVAATVVFIFLAVNQVRIWMAPKEIQQASLTGISPEYAEVEFYYTHAINSGIENLNYLTDAGLISLAENKMIHQEFREFETRFASLQQEFNANPDDERVINAMIEYYQAKLNVINLIVNKLQEVKQKNNESHETKI